MKFDILQSRSSNSKRRISVKIFKLLTQSVTSFYVNRFFNSRAHSLREKYQNKMPFYSSQTVNFLRVFFHFSYMFRL